MDSGRSSPIQPAGVEVNDWRDQLSADARQEIVGHITETLKKNHSIDGEKFRDLAGKFEEKIYNAAKSHRDYQNKISIKMAVMGITPQKKLTKSRKKLPKSLPSNHAPNTSNPDLTIHLSADELTTADDTEWKAQLQNSSLQKNVSHYASGSGYSSPSARISQLRDSQSAVVRQVGLIDERLTSISRNQETIIQEQTVIRQELAQLISLLSGSSGTSTSKAHPPPSSHSQ